MNGKSKYLILVFGIISFGFMLVGGTFAFLSFAATVTNASYNGTTTCFDLDYSSGQAITGTMFQSSTPQGGLTGSVTMNIKSNCNVNGTGTITLNVGSETGSLLLSEGALKYAVYDSANANVLASGAITGTGNKDLYTGFDLSKTATTYHIYVWLDGNIADNDYVNLPFSGYIHASAIQTES